tara:strand:+ start:582 stop:1355 length:774 start_codon:yes stop_codon:yes gene_type:complete
MENIKLENFSTGYKNKIIIKPMNLTIKSDNWLGIIGANGSGKSTLVRAICRIIKPFEGKVLLKGKDLNKLSNRYISQKISFLPQGTNPNLLISVNDLVALGRSPYKKFWDFDLNKKDKSIIEDSLKLVDIFDLKECLLNEISGGQRQRAFLALALAQETEIIILDEPTNYLDINHQIKFLKILKDLQLKKNLTIITVLHDLNLTARFSDRIAALKKGVLLEVGYPKDVLTKENIKDIFDINVLISETEYGKQFYPIS